VSTRIPHLIIVSDHEMVSVFNKSGCLFNNLSNRFCEAHPNIDIIIIVTKSIAIIQIIFALVIDSVSLQYRFIYIMENLTFFRTAVLLSIEHKADLKEMTPNPGCT